MCKQINESVLKSHKPKWPDRNRKKKTGRAGSVIKFCILFRAESFISLSAGPAGPKYAFLFRARPRMLLYGPASARA